MKDHALNMFQRPPESLNCAQAVLAAYREVTGDRSIPLDDFKPWGGGRAPDGRCGALQAACALTADHADKLCQVFAARIGATRCKEIDAPCTECVTTAAALLNASTGLPRLDPPLGVSHGHPRAVLDNIALDVGAGREETDVTENDPDLVTDLEA